MSVADVASAAKSAASSIALAGGAVRTKAVLAMADEVGRAAATILVANSSDVDRARGEGASRALIDRLTLSEQRIESMVAGLTAVASQEDVVGETIEQWTRPNGLVIRKVRVPLGLVAVIYEARPNVTADVAGLCIKSGNAVLLRGSSHAQESNLAITDAVQRGLVNVGLPRDGVSLIEDTSRQAAVELMRLKGLVDLLVPRGGPELIRSIEEGASVPYIIDGDGNCHVYVDAQADLEKANAIVINAKTSRPSVCNAAEKLLVHRDLAEGWLPSVLDKLDSLGVEIRGDERVTRSWPRAKPATEADWRTEYLDLILAVKVVDSVTEAIQHINQYGTSNAEAIVTEDRAAANRFSEEVDSGTVFVNASTRFSDGSEFGFGGEIGISTQKLHARGPMGLRELTTYKYVVTGSGQVR